MSDTRKKMLRKFQQAQGCLENAQEHLFFILNVLGEEKPIIDMLSDLEAEKITKDNYRYPVQIKAILEINLGIDSVIEAIQSTREVT